MAGYTIGYLAGSLATKSINRLLAQAHLRVRRRADAEPGQCGAPDEEQQARRRGITPLLAG
jgi:hypothetical protein